MFYGHILPVFLLNFEVIQTFIHKLCQNMTLTFIVLYIF